MFGKLIKKIHTGYIIHIIELPIDNRYYYN